MKPCRRCRGRVRYAGGRGRCVTCQRVRNLLDGARRRSVRNGLPFNLTAAWLLERVRTGACQVTGVRFDFDSLGTHPTPRRPSIDRTVPRMGYTRENCRLVLWGFNGAKGNGTDRELRSWVREWIRNDRSMR